MSQIKAKTAKTQNWKKMVGKIHIGASKELHMDTKDRDPESAYHAMLFLVTKKRSCSQMKEWELENVIKHMGTLGCFKSDKKKNGQRYSPQSKNKNPGMKDQRDKIRAIWIEMGKQGYIKDGSETALGHWVAHMTAKANNGKGIASVEWLNPDVAQKVLEALKQWNAREERKRNNVS